MIDEKVKCKICSKVGLAKDVRGLRKHLRLSHNIITPKKYNQEEYFEVADSESQIEIFSGLRKLYIKDKNKEWHNWRKISKDTKSTKNPFARIIYTPMTNG